LFAQSLNRRHGVRDRLVPLALLFTNHQEAFFRRVSGLTWARIAACRKDNECEAEESFLACHWLRGILESLCYRFVDCAFLVAGM
jgi:hypothetical protein